MTIDHPKLMLTREFRGFTLVELLVVITIVGILAALALPSYNSFIAKQRIKSASFDITAALTFVRSEAIKRNTLVSIAPTSSDWSQGWTVTTSAGTVLGRQNAMPGITATCKQGNTASACNSLTYDLSGRISRTQQQFIQISNSTSVDTRCIGIDLSGRPNSKKGSC